MLREEYVQKLSDVDLDIKIMEAKDMMQEYHDDREILNDYKVDLKQLEAEKEGRDVVEDPLKKIEERVVELEAKVIELETQVAILANREYNE